MKKKGFTLVELLAVIVVLAIIALVVTPTILGVIDKAKESAFKSSVIGVMDSARIYIAENLDDYEPEEGIIFTCDGKTCKNSKNKKLNFKGEIPKSGKVKVQDGKYEVIFLSNGEFCASGTSKNLKIEEDCSKFDATKSSSVLTLIRTTTNEIIINVNSKDEESGIRKIEYYINDEKDGVQTFNNEKEITTNYIYKKLKNNTDYVLKILVTNGNDDIEELIVSGKTLNIENPEILFTNTPEEPQNGYFYKQVANVNYINTNIENPMYYLKTTRSGISSLEVNETCGAGYVPSECTEIESTTNLLENTWYKVSGNVDVTYDVYATEEATLYVTIGDGTNLSTYATAIISKISKEVEYTVNHYLMDMDGTNYTLKETENLKAYAHYSVTPNIKNYTGFTAPETESVIIKEDGSTVVNYYYTRNKYTVTVNKGTGIASVSGTESYYYGASVTVGYTLSTGYHFSSWSGDQTTATFTMPASNVSMTANGAANTYTVVYHGNGNTGGSTASSSHTYGTAQTLTANGFTKTGYTFAGWATSENGTVVYADKASVDNLTTTNNGSVNLYAKWTINSYTQVVKVRYQNADGTYGAYSNVINTSYNYGTTVSWSRAADSTYNAASITSYTVTGAKTTEVSVTRKTFTVTVNKGTGIASVSGGGTYRVGQSVTVGYTLSTGYAFSSWSGTYTSATFTMPSSNVTMTANGKAKVLTIVFNKNDGSGSTASQAFTYGASGNKFGYNNDGTAKWGTSGQFGSWTRTGYTLLGWAETSNATSAAYTTYSGVDHSWLNSKVSGATATLNLYAVWKLTDISFKVGDTVTITPGSYLYTSSTRAINKSSPLSANLCSSGYTWTATIKSFYTISGAASGTSYAKSSAGTVSAWVDVVYKNGSAALWEGYLNLNDLSK